MDTFKGNGTQQGPTGAGQEAPTHRAAPIEEWVSADGAPLIMTVEDAWLLARHGLIIKREVLSQSTTTKDGKTLFADYILSVRVEQGQQATVEAILPQRAPESLFVENSPQGPQYPQEEHAWAPRNAWREEWPVEYGHHKGKTLLQILQAHGPKALFFYHWRAEEMVKIHSNPENPKRSKKFLQVNRSMIAYIDLLLEDAGTVCPPQPGHWGGRAPKRKDGQQ